MKIQAFISVASLVLAVTMLVGLEGSAKSSDRAESVSVPTADLAPVTIPEVLVMGSAGNTIDLPEMTIVAKSAKSKGPSKAKRPGKPTIRKVGLDQGGRPGARTVLAWGV